MFSEGKHGERKNTRINSIRRRCQNVFTLVSFGASMQFLMGARRMEELVCFLRLGPCSGIRGRLLRDPSLACFSRLGRLQMLPTLDPGRLEDLPLQGG